MKRCATIIAVIVLALIGLSLWELFKEEYGVGVDSVSWLPPEAQNITYIENDLVRIAEFDIEQGEFEIWCANRGQPLQKLGDGERRTIDRCLWMLEHRGVIPAVTEPNKAERDLRELERTLKNFNAGDPFFEKRWSNGGGYTIGYDVRERRGYYSYSHH